MSARATLLWRIFSRLLFLALLAVALADFAGCLPDPPPSREAEAAQPEPTPSLYLVSGEPPFGRLTEIEWRGRPCLVLSGSKGFGAIWCEP